ncbi:MFS transporter [Caballeronia sp. J97]|uniref:MFS transporter n=1 Tax=Caballeronia sp. J97 TaxID=2805429 RepID=UPI002AAFC6AD|nr:MFS transporter [Caballeronia sp. J97]
MAIDTSISSSPRSAITADATYRQVAWRFMPLLFICYLVAYLDRVNVGFAKLQMLDDLHFSDAVYGLGAGLFFIGYFIFEVPSNLLLHRFGARRWISRIMITWAALSAATAWISTPTEFYVLRFLLGLAEAGFFPGMILYMSYWFPSSKRGKMTAILIAGNPVSGMIGGPISGYIMHSLSGAYGFAGWQWLFVVEAIPAAILGVVIFFYLDDRVEKASWLTEEQRSQIANDLKEDAPPQSHESVRGAFLSPAVWLLSLVFFGIVMGLYALGFWQPTIIKNAGVSDPLFVGLLTAIPYGCAVLSMFLAGAHADRTRERRWHVAIPTLAASVGFVLCALGGQSLLASMMGLTLIAIGTITAASGFWVLPVAFLRGTGAAAGVALISSVGNLAGFVSPTIMGWINARAHTLAPSLLLVSGSLLVSAFLVVVFIPAKAVNH